MLEKIVAGVLPSVVFRSLVDANPSLTNIQLAELLAEEFPELDSIAGQYLWRWKGPGKDQGLSDENLDRLLLQFFKNAQYL